MPARREIQGVPEDRVTKFTKWLKTEVTNKDKVAANLVGFSTAAFPSATIR